MDNIKVALLYLLNILRGIKNHLKRYYICWFRKDYIREWRKYRFGECRQCGNCCRILTWCPMLYRKEGKYKCLIYKWGRPLQCIEFPIDLHDLEEVNFNCGYSFIGRPDTINSFKCPA